MSEIDPGEIAKAIAPLVVGFEADGASVSVETADRNTVAINFHITAETCRECLLPQDHLEALLLQAVKAKGIDTRAVKVVFIDHEQEGKAD